MNSPIALAVGQRMTPSEIIGKLPKPKQTGKNQWSFHCPCDGHKDKKASGSASIGDDGRTLLHCHAGCSTDSILQALGLTLKDLFPSNGHGQEKQVPPWQKILDSTLPMNHPDAAPGSLYLENRGLHLQEYPADMPFHSSLDYYDDDEQKKTGTHPALVFIVRDRNGNPVGIQRIYLTPQGQKADVPEPKKAMGTISGGAIYFGEYSNSLNVAEGPETGLAVFQATGMPTCSTVSASGMSKFQIPDNVQIIDIWADLDKSEAGQKAAIELAQRAHDAGKTVYLRLPTGKIPDANKSIDWLNVLNAEGTEAFQYAMERGEPWQPLKQQDNDPWNETTFTLADAYKPRPDHEYIVENLFPIPSLNMVYGHPGCFKSAILAEMCVCVAAGLPWLPRDSEDIYGKRTMQAPVQWLDFDNGDITHNRFEAFGRARNLPEDLPLFYTVMPNPWLDSADEVQMMALADRLKRRGIRLLIIDNFKTICGRLDENKPEVSVIMSNLRRMADRLSLCIILIHHPPKADDEILRGHGSILAALDLSLHVRRDAAMDDIHVQAKKIRGSAPEPFSAHFEYIHKPGTRELQTARFWAIGRESASIAHLTKSQEEVLNIVGQCSKITLDMISRKVRKCSPETAKRAAWDLAKLGLIQRIDNGGKGREAVFSPVIKGVTNESSQGKFPCSVSDMGVIEPIVTGCEGASDY